MSSRVAIVAGSIAQRPGNGGHTWVFLQYLLGLRSLGWDVLFLDRLEPEMCFDRDGRPTQLEGSVNLRYLEAVMRSFDLEGSYALLYDQSRRCIGVSREDLLAHARRTAIVLNVNGFIDDEEVLGRSALRVFLDIDPGFGQMWRELGLHDAFHDHDAYVTVGQNIGETDCAIPTGGLDWITTPQPVVLEEWPARLNGQSSFTGIGTWRGPFAPIEYRGVTYGLRVHEFRKFVELPRLSGDRFELALDIDDSEVEDLELLRKNGWSLVKPDDVASDPSTYRRYIQQSKAEFMVAKNMYVEARSGWFSDRSICYLASGKPVIAQETGFSRHYPTGLGLLAFSTLDEALAAVDDVSVNYEQHSHAARAIAQEHFASEHVLTRLLDRLGVT